MEKLLGTIRAMHAHFQGKTPDLAQATLWLNELVSFLFPLPGSPCTDLKCLERSADQLRALLSFANDEDAANKLVHQFYNQLAHTHQQLLADADYILRYDPAALSLEEVVTTYPGFRAIVHHRLAHLLFRLGVPLLPRFIAEAAHTQTGIDIHPGAQIASPFFIDHGTGIVIGETAIIESHVRMYQGVTLGAISVDKTLAGTRRHPHIGQGTVIYANATILGGETQIGEFSIVGGNVWLTRSIEPYSVVFHHSEVKVRSQMEDEPLNFVI